MGIPVGWDSHKLLWYVMGQTNTSQGQSCKTPTARHQNVAQHVSSKKPLNTKTADRHTHARSYHYA